MGFETYQNIAKQKIEHLHEAGLESPVLEHIESFIASPEVRHAAKAVQSYDDLQIWWHGETDRSNEYDHLCLTFALRSLTISLDHMHTDNHFPLFPNETSANSYTLLIKPTVTEQEAAALRTIDQAPTLTSEGAYVAPRTFVSLHQSNTLRAGTQPTEYGHEALRIFQPRFDHTLRMLGFRATTPDVIPSIELVS